MSTGDLTIEQLKLVLGAEGWKAFMAEVAAARGSGRDVVVRRRLAVAETMRAEKLAEQIRAEVKARGRARATARSVFTRARKARRKIIESMSTDQVQDLLTSDEELSWLRSVTRHPLEPTIIHSSAHTE